MPEADTLGLHHPVDHRAAALAGPQAVPQVLVRADHQAGLMVVVEGTQSDQICPVALELNTTAFRQALEGDVLLQAGQLIVRDLHHNSASW